MLNTTMFGVGVATFQNRILQFSVDHELD